MRRILLVLSLATLVLVAGCAEPGGTDDDGGEVNETETVTDNEFGADPNNPPNATSPTVIETSVTPNATDGGDVEVEETINDSEPTPTDPETSVTANATAAEEPTETIIG